VPAAGDECQPVGEIGAAGAGDEGGWVSGVEGEQRGVENILGV